MSYIKNIQEMSTQDLESGVFHYDTAYFDYIGQNHPDVVAFRSLIEQRDLHGLTKEWPRLANTFVRLEKLAGRTGRPYIMDYYFTQEESLAELAKRHGIECRPTNAESLP